MGTQYKKKYNDLMECLMQMHENNLKRTKFALRSLIVVEYQDYMLRRIISDAEIDGSAADEALDEAFEYDNYREAPSEDDQQ